jgi:hypothetical protein
MKHLMIALGTLVTALYLANVPALAQGRPGGGSVGASHGPSSHTSSTTTGRSTDSGPNPNALPSAVFAHSPNLATNLTNALIKSGVFPANTPSSTLTSDCNGFRTLGRCIAALHVAHNHDINFFCLREELTGNTTNATGCPTGTTPNGAKNLGKAIQFFDPKADPKAEASKGTKQANDDINSAKS